eukprot:GCRY01006123.1.p1 GENE.GCRY01006123.1~~GCRY01006123.1.p1  ORF type:complete len:289 (-),score=33.75 GCRY01006123.1:78-944(-)
MQNTLNQKHQTVTVLSKEKDNALQTISSLRDELAVLGNQLAEMNICSQKQKDHFLNIKKEVESYKAKIKLLQEEIQEIENSASETVLPPKILRDAEIQMQRPSFASIGIECHFNLEEELQRPLESVQKYVVVRKTVSEKKFVNGELLWFLTPAMLRDLDLAQKQRDELKLALSSTLEQKQSLEAQIGQKSAELNGLKKEMMQIKKKLETTRIAQPEKENNLRFERVREAGTQTKGSFNLRLEELAAVAQSEKAVPQDMSPAFRLPTLNPVSSKNLLKIRSNKSLAHKS